VGHLPGEDDKIPKKMSFDATIVNVMIASPSDVATERQIVRDVVSGWNAIHAQDRQLVLLPCAWETHASPAMGDRAQAIINKQLLKQCDLLVAVFWTRLGSPTGEAKSGTVEEINEHLAASKPAMLYFSDAPVRPDSVDDEQYRALRDFREDCKRRGLIETYSSLEEFRDKFTRQLTQTVLRQFRGLEPPDEREILGFEERGAVPDLSAESQQLLIECSGDSGGTVLAIGTLEGFRVQSNGKQFVQTGSPRSEAKWKSALDELMALGLLEDRGHKGEVLGLTNAGYEVADRLRQIGAPSDQGTKASELKISISVEGAPPTQALQVNSNHPISVSRVEYMLSNETCVQAQDVSLSGDKLDVPLSHDAIRKVWNVPRPDRNHSDHSGPAKIGVTVGSQGRTRQYILPVQMENHFQGSTMYARLVGSKTYYEQRAE